jgi:hypothetical protein
LFVFGPRYLSTGLPVKRLSPLALAASRDSEHPPDPIANDFDGNDIEPIVAHREQIIVLRFIMSGYPKIEYI